MPKFQKGNKRNNYLDNPKYDTGKFTERESTSIAVGLSTKALKDLPRTSVTVKVDPYTNIAPSSTPYNILANFNRKVGGSYGGTDNLDGGNVQQYASSVTSGFLSAFDTAILKLGVNYHFTPVKADPDEVGYNLINEARKSIAEATSLLQATTFTQMAINSFAIETSMPMGDATTTSIGNHNVYTELPDVLYAGYVYYQLTLQQIANVFNWHNSFRLKQGTAIRSSWNREVPKLNSLFGYFNKKSFLNILEGMALSFTGEYTDVEWVKQMGMLNITPSRRSDCISDPVLEIQTRINMPDTFNVYVIAGTGADRVLTPIFSSSQTAVTEGLSACNTIYDKLSLNNVLTWARTDSETELSYFNAIKTAFDKVNAWLSYFKRQMTDFREAMDIMVRTGTVQWTKGYTPIITKDNDAQLPHNLLVENIYHLTMSGAVSLDFNNNTKRWRSFSLWNMYHGIPEYDAKSGGAFLSMSLKDLQFTLDDDDNHKYLPICLTPWSGNLTDVVSAQFTNRLGDTSLVTPTSYVMSEDAVLARLVPLPSQADLAIKIPVALASASLSTAAKSHLYKQLVSVFGVAGVYTKSSTLELGLDPDILAIYQYEIEDITNISIAYARGNSPFRPAGAIPPHIGFSGINSAK